MIDRLQLFIHRLHLFLRGGQLFIRALQLLIGRLELFIGRFQLFLRGLHLFAGGVQLLSGMLELPLDLRHIILLAGRDRFSLRRPVGMRRDITEDDQDRSLHRVGLGLGLDG